MTFLKIILCLSFAITFSFRISAQNGKQPSKKLLKNGTITTIIKFKPPVVKTYLGVNANDASVTIDEAGRLLNLPLKVADSKNNVYNISSYQFLYKKKSIVEDEESGRKRVAFTTTADFFKSTPLPKIWRDNITGGLQKDEELLFFDVIVNDKQNRKFFAPNLKIIVK